jgi:hypothetical protein
MSATGACQAARWSAKYRDARGVLPTGHLRPETDRLFRPKRSLARNPGGDEGARSQGTTPPGLWSFGGGWGFTTGSRAGRRRQPPAKNGWVALQNVNRARRAVS